MSPVETETPGMVQHHDSSPLIIVGNGRSGTTILTRLIRQHLQIAFGTESQFIPRLADRLPKFGDLKVEANRRRFVDTLATERFFARTRKNYGFMLDVDAVVQRSAAGTYRSILDAVFGQLAAHMGFVRWGDKTPEYVHRLPLLYALYPEARFVHVVRDGRDVALSTFETHFGAKNAFAAAHEWRRCVSDVEDFRRANPAARILDVRYEDLLEQPERVFRSLIDFLDIGSRDELMAHVGPLVKAELRSGNSKKWKARFSPGEQRRFEAVAGSWLERYGYERVAPHAPAPGVLAAMYWYADNLVRRAATDGYWRDSLYRLGLRLGTVGRPLRRFGQLKSAR